MRIHPRIQTLRTTLFLLMISTASLSRAESATLAICTPSNESSSGEPLVVVASGSFARLGGPDGERSYPVADLRKVSAGYLDFLTNQGPSSVVTNVNPKKGQETILELGRNGLPADTAFELLSIDVETEMNFPEGRTLIMKATIPTGNNSVTWSFVDQSSEFSRSGNIETHCLMRKSFVR